MNILSLMVYIVKGFPKTRLSPAERGFALYITPIDISVTVAFIPLKNCIAHL